LRICRNDKRIHTLRISAQSRRVRRCC
jgi:hypothetical protein